MISSLKRPGRVCARPRLRARVSELGKRDAKHVQLAPRSRRDDCLHVLRECPWCRGAVALPCQTVSRSCLVELCHVFAEEHEPYSRAIHHSKRLICLAYAAVRPMSWNSRRHRAAGIEAEAAALPGSAPQYRRRLEWMEEQTGVSVSRTFRNFPRELAIGHGYADYCVDFALLAAGVTSSITLLLKDGFHSCCNLSEQVAIALMRLPFAMRLLKPSWRIVREQPCSPNRSSAQYLTGNQAQLRSGPMCPCRCRLCPIAANFGRWLDWAIVLAGETRTVG